MRRLHMGLLLCIGVLFIPISSVVSKEIDEPTRDSLAAIIAGYHSNQEQIANLTMSGDIHVERQSDAIRDKEVITFAHCQLGEKRRIDEVYKDSSHPIKAGHPVILVDTGKTTLKYYAGNRNTASVDKRSRFHMSTKLTYLDTLAIIADRRTYVDHLEQLLDKKWQPENENLLVQTIKKDNQRLLKVIYRWRSESAEGQYLYFFDPQRGYQVIEASRYTDLRDGSPYEKHKATYQLSEILPNVWRPTVGDITVNDWDIRAGGLLTHTTMQIRTKRIVANTDTLKEDFFTFRGMGVLPGSIVQDRTVKPATRYQLDDNNLEQLDNGKN